MSKMTDEKTPANRVHNRGEIARIRILAEQIEQDYINACNHGRYNEMTAILRANLERFGYALVLRESIDGKSQDRAEDQRRAEADLFGPEEARRQSA